MHQNLINSHILTSLNFASFFKLQALMNNIDDQIPVDLVNKLSRNHETLPKNPGSLKINIFLFKAVHLRIMLDVTQSS